VLEQSTTISATGCPKSYKVKKKHHEKKVKKRRRG
jgi:hypothetical protein